MLYRVCIKSTSSLQPDSSFWKKRVLYCGYDREEAKRVYYENEPEDTQYQNYGSSFRQTLFQVIKDEGTDSTGDDVIETMSIG